MTNNIMEALNIGLEAAGALPWQVQLGMAAGGVLIGIIGSVIGWFGHKRKSHKVGSEPAK
ncbi:MAG: hypothetical protein PHW60_05740 [Kiritimatiellae bacterium]|nr:hypothetical protein [Kiritimatiellia bacterium]